MPVVYRMPFPYERHSCCRWRENVRLNLQSWEPGRESKASLDLIVHTVKTMLDAPCSRDLPKEEEHE